MRHDDTPPEAPVIEPEPELVVEPVPPAESAVGADDGGAALFGTDDVARFHRRWRELQADFVDDPERAVRSADELVGEVTGALSEIVAGHRRSIGDRGNGAGGTEALRVALHGYRSLFDRLLGT